MAKPRRPFSINEVPSLDVSAGAVYVDIGYLAHDDHLNAFVDIFAKFVHDNAETIRAYEHVFAKAKKALGPEVHRLEGSDGVERLVSDAREIARALYTSLNEKVHLTFQGKGGAKELIVMFDNPSFEFL
jgi:hypothetical protein